MFPVNNENKTAFPFLSHLKFDCFSDLFNRAEYIFIISDNKRFARLYDLDFDFSIFYQTAKIFFEFSRWVNIFREKCILFMLMHQVFYRSFHEFLAHLSNV